VIGMLVNPNFPDAKAQARQAQEAARALGRQIYVPWSSRQNSNRSSTWKLRRRLAWRSRPRCSCGRIRSSS